MNTTPIKRDEYVTYMGDWGDELAQVVEILDDGMVYIRLGNSDDYLTVSVARLKTISIRNNGTGLVIG